MVTKELLQARKVELEETRERLWAELNQILGAIALCDGLLAVSEQPEGENKP